MHRHELAAFAVFACMLLWVAFVFALTALVGAVL